VAMPLFRDFPNCLLTIVTIIFLDLHISKPLQVSVVLDTAKRVWSKLRIVKEKKEKLKFQRK
jgi:hypothetical protein